MFEKLIEQLLQSLIGDYVDGLDAQTLRVGIWSGSAQLVNVRLKPDALLKLGIPFMVKYSKLGTINLQIPWKNLASAPLKASLNTLHIILEPQKQSDWRFGQPSPQEKIIAIETFKRKLLAKISALEEKKDGMMSRILVRVIENIQISIQNIHIRVEDSISSSGCSYGFVLQTFSCVTVDQNGRETFIDRTSEANKQCELKKALKVERFGLYWNADGLDRLTEAHMGELIPIEKHLFLLSLDIKAVQPPKNCQDRPDYAFELELGTFQINLSKTQLQQGVSLSEYFTQYRRNQLMAFKQQKELKPLDQQQTQQLQAILRRIPLDKKINESISKEDTEQLLRLLEDTSLELITPSLLQVFKELRYEEMKNDSLKKKQGGGGGLFGYFSKQKPKEVPQTLSQQEEEEILKFLNDNFQVEEQASVQWITVRAVMNQGNIGLSNPRKNGSADKLDVKFEGLLVNLRKDSKLDLNLSLLDMQVIFQQAKLYHELLTNSTKDKSEPLFLLAYGRDEEFAQSIKVKTRSSKVHFHPNITPVLKDFADIDLRSDNIKNIADEKYQQIKSNASNALQQQVKIKSKRSIKVELSQCFIQIPIDASQSWLFSPGHLAIFGESSDRGDSFQLKLDKINFTHCQSQAQLEAEISTQLKGQQQSETQRVMGDFQIEIQVKTGEDNLVQATVSDIQLNLSPNNYNLLLRIGDCFTPGISQDDYKSQSIIVAKVVDQAQKKQEILNSASLIGPLYLREGQLNQWVKYTCVLCDPYIYFYSSPKDLNPKYQKWVKNSTILDLGIDEFKMNVLKIQNNYFTFEVGINSKLNDWVSKISLIKDQDALIDQFFQNEERSETPAVVTTKIELAFHRLDIHFSDSENRRFMVASTNSMKLSMLSQPNILRMKLILSSLSVKDYVKKYADPALDSLLRSQEDTDLICIELEKIDRKCSLYQNKDIAIKMDFGYIRLNFKSESIALLLQFFNSTPTSSSNSSELRSDAQQQEFLEADQKYVLFHLELNIRQIDFFIVHEITKLSLLGLHFERGKIKYSKLCDEQIVDLSLGNVVVNDLTNYPNTLFQEQDYIQQVPQLIIGIQDAKNSLLEVHVVLIEKQSMKATQNRDLIQVQVKVSSIILNYKQQPILRIVDYLQKDLQDPLTNPFSFGKTGFTIKCAGQQVSNIQQSSRLVVDPTLNLPDSEAQAFLKDPPKMRVAVEIENPQIRLETYYSKHVLVLNLGYISINNQYFNQNERQWRQQYNISIKQMGIVAIMNTAANLVIASQFDFRLEVSLPAFQEYQKRLLDPKVVDEVIRINAEMTSFILQINRQVFDLILETVATININDYFDDYVLLNQSLSAQITQEQSQSIVVQEAERRQWTTNDFLQFNLNINNISLFLCTELPIQRLSILNLEIRFVLKKNTKKELNVNCLAIDSCVYKKQPNPAVYLQQPMIGISPHQDIPAEDMSNLQQLTKHICNQRSDESIKIEFYANPSATKNFIKLNLTLQKFLLTLQTDELFKVIEIFSTSQVYEPIPNKFQEYSDRISLMVNNKFDEKGNPNVTEFFIKLKDITIALPTSMNNSVVTLTGDITVTLNLFDTLTVPQLLMRQVNERLSIVDLKSLNNKLAFSFCMNEVQLYITTWDALITNIQEGRRQILFPLFFTINLKEQLVISDDQTQLENNKTLQMAFSPCSFRIAFSDILFLKCLLDEQTQILQKYQNKGESSETSKLLPSDEVTAVSKAPLATKSNTTSAEYYQIQVHMMLDKLDVITINDFGTSFQYLMKFQLCSGELKLELRPNAQHGEFKAPFELIYFNTRIAQWEPVIEQANFKFIYLNKIDKVCPFTQAFLQFPQQVNINLPTELFYNINQTMKLFDRQFRNQKPLWNQIGNDFAKYAISNQCGTTILCYIQGSNSYEIVTDRQYKSFDVKCPKSYNYIDIQIQGDNFHYEIKNWNIDKIGKQTRRFKEVFFFVSTSINDDSNQKVVTVYSQVMIQNLTKYELNLFALQQRGFLNSKEIVNQTNCQLKEFSNQITHGRLGLHQFSVSNEFTGFYLLKPTGQPIKFEPIAFTHLIKNVNNYHQVWLSKDFVVVLKVNEDPDFKLRFIINILPYLRIQNFLPFPISFKFRYGNQYSELVTLQVEESVDEHKVYSHSRSIHLQLDTHVQQFPLDLQSHQSFKKYLTKVSLKSEEWSGEKRPTYSEIIQSFDINEQGVQCLQFYAGQYAINDTGINLVISQGRGDSFTIVGGQKFGSIDRVILLNDYTEDSDLSFSQRETPQLLSLNPTNFKVIGKSYSDVLIKKNNDLYLIPLIVQSEMKRIMSAVSKQVTIRYRFIIVNLCGVPFQISQKYTKQVIKPGERQPLEIACGNFHPQSIDLIYRITLIDDYEWNQAGPIDFSQIASHSLQLKSSKEPQIRKFISLTFSEENSCVFIVAKEIEHDRAPYKITNQSHLAKIKMQSIQFCELSFGDSGYFALDDPYSHEVNLTFFPVAQDTFEPQNYSLKLDKLLHPKIVKLKSSPVHLKIIIRIEGYTRHVTIQDSHEGEAEEYQNEAPLDKRKTLDLQLLSVSISIIENSDNNPLEILFISLLKTEAIAVVNTSDKLEFQLRVEKFQIDNMSSVYPSFPVLLGLLPKAKNQHLPMINFHIVLNQSAKNLQLIEKISIETNFLFIKVDDQIIFYVQKYVQGIQKMLGNEAKPFTESNKRLNWLTCPVPESKVPTYIAQLSIMPIVIELSVHLGKLKKQADQRDSLAELLQGIGVKLVNISDAEIKLAGLTLNDCVDTFPGIMSKLIAVYQECVMGQLVSLIGSISILGNPTKLFKSVTSGIQDFVERPMEGITKGPLELGAGVVSGTTSLVSHTMVGTFNTVKTITGTLSSGLTKMSMDEEYEQERRISNQVQAQNIGVGLAEGTKSLARGIKDGLWGFVAKPIEGAQKDGAQGLLKGFLKGTTGLIVKPVAGALDVVSKTSEGVRNTFQQEEMASSERMRYMRAFYNLEGCYQVYEINDGIGYELMKKLKKGKYSKCKYIKTYQFEKDNKPFLITISEACVVLFDKEKMLKLWSLTFDDILQISNQDQVVQLRLRKSKKAFNVSLFLCQSNQITYLQIKNEGVRKQILETLMQTQEQNKQLKEQQ